MNVIFPIYENYMDTFRGFCNEIQPFNEQFESDNFQEFDVITKELEEELVAAQTQLKDVGIDGQHDELINISNNIERDSRHWDTYNPPASEA